MPDKKVKRYRGPSRPVDPRYAPSPVAKKGPDTFGMALVGISVAVVLVIILWAAVSSGGTAGVVSSTGQISQSVNQSDQATAQALVVATQVVVDATETAGLPRIEPAEAISLANAGNAMIVDVRGRENYLQGHIKGSTNIPESEVSKRMAEFPKLGNLIVYCQ